MNAKNVPADKRDVLGYGDIWTFIHRSLRCPPAMAAGVTSSAWSISDLIKVTEEYEITRDWPLAHAS